LLPSLWFFQMNIHHHLLLRLPGREADSEGL
jgi:hypothetical protein